MNVNEPDLVRLFLSLRTRQNNNADVPRPRHDNISALEDSQKEEELDRIAEEVIKSLDHKLYFNCTLPPFDYGLFRALIRNRTNGAIDPLDYEPAEPGDIGGFQERVVEFFKEKIIQHMVLIFANNEARAEAEHRAKMKRHEAEIQRKSVERRRNALMEFRDKLDAEHRAKMERLDADLERLDADLAQLNVAHGNVANGEGADSSLRTIAALEEQVFKNKLHQQTMDGKAANEEQAVDPLPPPASTTPPRCSPRRSPRRLPRRSPRLQGRSS